MTTTIKAQIAQVHIGHLTVEGLMDSAGVFYIAVPQVAERFSVLPQNASRTFNRLMGAGFQFLRLKTPLHPKAVNAITLDVFEKLVAKLDRAGNQQAQDFRDDLAGLSLHQLFSDAFGVKFDEDDRQRWMRDRQEGKAVRRTLTDAIKNYIDLNPSLSANAIRFMYSNASDAVNRAVFARPAKKLCEDLKVSDRDLLRDSLTDKELRHVQQVEDLAMRLIDSFEFEPLTAVKEARERLVIPVSDRVAV
jgi:hypothetical protein